MNPNLLESQAQSQLLGATEGPPVHNSMGWIVLPHKYETVTSIGAIDSTSDITANPPPAFEIEFPADKLEALEQQPSEFSDLPHDDDDDL